MTLKNTDTSISMEEQLMSILNLEETIGKKLEQLSKLYCLYDNQSLHNTRTISKESPGQADAQVLEWLMSLSEVPDEQAELFCDLGEFLCRYEALSEKILFFKAQRLFFHFSNENSKQAHKVLDDLRQLIPDSDFIHEWTQKLQELDTKNTDVPM